MDLTTLVLSLSRNKNFLPVNIETHFYSRIWGMIASGWSQKTNGDGGGDYNRGEKNLTWWVKCYYICFQIQKNYFSHQ